MLPILPAQSPPIWPTKAPVLTERDVRVGRAGRPPNDSGGRFGSRLPMRRTIGLMKILFVQLHQPPPCIERPAGDGHRDTDDMASEQDVQGRDNSEAPTTPHHLRTPLSPDNRRVHDTPPTPLTPLRIVVPPPRWLLGEPLPAMVTKGAPSTTHERVPPVPPFY